jgi:nitrogenase-associated protein
MAIVTFYEKPGCQGNLRQKLLLAAAGHIVRARNLKAETWSADRLLAFIGNLEIGEWFNRNAPALKSGDIVPENLGFEEALRLLLDNPLLIRRPLMEVEIEVERGTRIERRVGFDYAAVDGWIGLNNVALPQGDGEACTHGAEGHDSCGRAAYEKPADKDEESRHGRCGAH